MIYYQDNKLLIRTMEIGDGKIFHETYLSYGWDSSIEVYKNYYIEQEENKRKVFVAVCEGEVCGYCTLVLDPAEGPWIGKGYPEIVDLSVFNTCKTEELATNFLMLLNKMLQKFLTQYF